MGVAPILCFMLAIVSVTCFKSGSQSILIPSMRPGVNNRPQAIPGAHIRLQTSQALIPPNGQQQDTVAPTKQLQVPLPITCKDPVCSTKCRYGTKMAQDVNGCDECRCKPRPSCPQDPPCALTSTCPYGIKRIGGCLSPVCECNTQMCPQISCPAQTCARGFAKDEPGFGCPTCECKRRSNSLACRKYDCLSTLNCPSGSEVDTVRGCPVCRCSTPAVCPQLTCTCVHGHIMSGGCPTCDCKQLPVDCPILQCPRSECTEGFVTDNNGCPTCTCNAPSTRQSTRRQSSRRQSSRRTSSRRQSSRSRSGTV